MEKVYVLQISGYDDDIGYFSEIDGVYKNLEDAKQKLKSNINDFINKVRKGETYFISKDYSIKKIDDRGVTIWNSMFVYYYGCFINEQDLQ